MAQEPWRVPDYDPEKHKITHDLDGKPLRSNYSGHTSPLTRALAFIIGMLLLIIGLALAFPASGFIDPYLVKAIVIMFIFGGAAAFWSRSSILRLVKVMGVWIIIIASISGFYLYRSDFSERFMSAVDPAGVVTSGDALVVRRGNDGHFWLRASFNGVPIKLMVDTGASNIVLSPDDASAVGLHSGILEFNGRAETANGSVPFARSTVSVVGVGDRKYFDVPVTVNGAEMQGSLFGMTMLNKFTSVEFRGDTLILRP
ncbi:retropepsin-like aspartic protease family protein [Kordiimonas aquimaris]|uniref:retropepsin-like aspartic protease family protein n=1 Tax=Kordiimonas aquimaris TaxID=707591 RepID=UPI0021D1270E|nr:TIGR02281 family clan AA aspartic protease [Kordiimonas aquimaris]